MASKHPRSRLHAEFRHRSQIPMSYVETGVFCLLATGVGLSLCSCSLKESQ